MGQLSELELQNLRHNCTSPPKRKSPSPIASVPSPSDISSAIALRFVKIAG